MHRMTRIWKALAPHVPELAPGTVWLAGAGPGDPGHLTLFTLAGLAQADVVVHDALIDPRVLDLIPDGVTRIAAGKRAGQPSWSQEQITTTLIAHARKGQRVLRLKGGDPMVFGRGGEEIFALARANIPCRVVPGVTSGLAGLTAAHIPATLRGVNQAIILVTGHDTSGPSALDWQALARLGQPIVFYMGLTHWPQIAAALQEAGLSPQTPAAAIAAATTPHQRVVTGTVADLHQRLQATDLPTPVLLVVGHIVAARAELEALAVNTQEALQWPRAE